MVAPKSKRVKKFVPIHMISLAENKEANYIKNLNVMKINICENMKVPADQKSDSVA